LVLFPIVREVGVIHLSLGTHKSELCATDAGGVRRHIVTKTSTQCKYHRELLTEAARLLCHEPGATAESVKQLVTDFAARL
jgi:hypothetical protein